MKGLSSAQVENFCVNRCLQLCEVSALNVIKKRRENFHVRFLLSTASVCPSLSSALHTFFCL